MLQSDARAGLLALLVFLLPVVKLFALFIVAYVAIERGLRSAAVVVAFMLIPALCFAIKGYPAALLLALPSLCFVGFSIFWLRRNRESLQTLLLPLTALGLCIVFIALASPSFGWQPFWLEITSYLKVNAAQYQQSLPKEVLDYVQLKEMMQFLGGFYIAMELLVAFFCMLCAARVWQGYPHRNQSAKPIHLAMDQVRVAPWYLLLLLVLGVACFYWQPMWFYALISVCVIPCLIAGFSLLAYSKRLPGLIRGLWLLLLLVVLGLLLAPVMLLAACYVLGACLVLMAVLGLLDVVLNCRSFAWLNKRREAA